MGAMSFDVSARLNTRYGPKATLIPSMVVIAAGLVLSRRRRWTRTTRPICCRRRPTGLGAGLAFRR